MTGSAGAVDEDQLARAVALAGGDESATSPNPTVGCVIVAPDGRVVGTGRTEPPGGRHAEVVALDAAGAEAAGATAYVSLEPCDHHGRTGPCSVALRDAGVARVVVAHRDPVPGHGGGIGTLREAGVDVEVMTDEGWAAAASPRFLARARTGRPWVTLKLAHTAAGATVPPAGRWISGTAARRLVHAHRATHDAVLVGVGTVLADDPRLDVRHVPAPPVHPRPVVLDSRARTPPTARVVRRGALVVVTRHAPSGRTAALADAGAEVVVVAADGEGRVDPGAALVELGARELHDVFAEPGDRLSTALVDHGCVDELLLHHPRGPVGRRPVAFREGRWSLVGVTRLGGDVEEAWRPAPCGDVAAAP